MLNCLFVGVGGFLGAVARYLCTRLPLAPEGGFPLVTLLINVLGAFVIGLIAAGASKQTGWDPRSRAAAQDRRVRRLHDVFDLCARDIVAAAEREAVDGRGLYRPERAAERGRGSARRAARGLIRTGRFALLKQRCAVVEQQHAQQRDAAAAERGGGEGTAPK